MTSVHKLREFLQSLVTFDEFSPAEIKALSHYMKLQDVDDGHVFTTQGQRGKHCFIIVEGDVSVSRRDEISGREEELKVLGRGEVFGVLSLLDDLPAAANCTARGPVTVAALPRSDYKAMFKIDAPAAYHFQFLVARQLAQDIQARNRALRAAL
jgi:CRP-like cAMP-binding protein